MREKPILFSAPMVRAILEERKTQTRRKVDVDKLYSIGGRSEISEWGQKNGQWYACFKWNAVIDVKCPYGEVGDRLWIREKWRLPGAHFDTKLASYGDNASLFFKDMICYAADENEADYAGTYRPSIFLPRWGSRITLEITNVRVERLWDISHDDAIAEGSSGQGWKVSDDRSPVVYPTHEFRQLWIKINGEGSWASNPWVWAITFKRVEA